MALSVTSPFWQQVATPALDMRRYFMSMIATEGVRVSGDMAVTQRGAGANMSVDIAGGLALVQGDTDANQGFYMAFNDATYNLTGFTAAHATNPRIDRIVLRVRDAFHGEGANDEAFVILTGTATSGATLANLTNAAAVGNGQLLLANVLIPATSTSITTANIQNVAPVMRSVGGWISYPNGAQVDVTNSTTETSLVDETIAANVMGTNKLARLTCIGDFLQNTAGNVTIRVKFGGVTVWADTLTFGNNANRRRLHIDVFVGNRGATNSQDVGGFFRLGNVGAATTGLGDISVSDGIETTIGASADPAVDTIAAQHLVVSAQWDTNSASLSVRKRYSIVEIIG